MQITIPHVCRSGLALQLFVGQIYQLDEKKLQLKKSNILGKGASHVQCKENSLLIINVKTNKSRSFPYSVECGCVFNA